MQEFGCKLYCLSWVCFFSVYSATDSCIGINRPVVNISCYINVFEMHQYQDFVRIFFENCIQGIRDVNQDADFTMFTG